MAPTYQQGMVTRKCEEGQHGNAFTRASLDLSLFCVRASLTLPEENMSSKKSLRPHTNPVNDVMIATSCA
eukprot:52588-Eustigmatos_ZCMA.PRE.1